MIDDFFNILLPQASLGIFILAQLVLSSIATPRHYDFARLLTLIGLFTTTLVLLTVDTEPQYFGFNKSVVSDNYTILFHLVILLCSLFVATLTNRLANTLKKNAFTIQALFLTAVLGALCIISANDFLTLFVSIELMAFPTYFLIACAKGYHAKEASFKYLITNAVSTGFFLLGVSYMYGITSSLNFSVIYETMAEADSALIYTVSSLLIIAGLVSKLSLFPFANWVIDVYKGTETSILAYLSTIPKLAMFGIICRLLVFP